MTKKQYHIEIDVKDSYETCKRLLEKNPYVYSINMIETLINGKKSRSLKDFNNDRDKVILNSFKRMVKKAIREGEITMDFLLNGNAIEVEKFLAYKSVKIPGNWEYNQNVFSKFKLFNSYRDLKYHRSLIKEHEAKHPSGRLFTIVENDKFVYFNSSIGDLTMEKACEIMNGRKLNLGF